MDVTDTTLATELLLLDRCLESLRASAPAARHLQARIVVHLAHEPHAGPACETVVTLVQHYLQDAGVALLPEDVASGPTRTLRFRPSMGWVTHTPPADEPRAMTGREAALPAALRQALEQLFDAPVAHVRIIEHSWFTRLHGRAVATTRRRRIYLRGSAADFFADPG